MFLWTVALAAPLSVICLFLPSIRGSPFAKRPSVPSSTFTLGDTPFFRQAFPVASRLQATVAFMLTMSRLVPGRRYYVLVIVVRWLGLRALGAPQVTSKGTSSTVDTCR